MEETTETPAPKKHRGWPKGKPRKKTQTLTDTARANQLLFSEGTGKLATTPRIFSASEPEAPIHVRVRLKNYEKDIEFGCARRAVENGFHVFFYPSERDRYRETRREFAVSEIVEIEITEARQTVAPAVFDYRTGFPEQPSVPASTGPKIHSARQAALSALETSTGPIKMDEMPRISFGDHAG